jgi:hypothetical protein
MQTRQEPRRDINFRLLMVVWVVGAMLLLVIVLAVDAFYQATEQSEYAQYADVQNLSLAELRIEQQTRLNTARWVDRDNQVVAIPIDEAMKIMVQTQGNLPTTQPATRPTTQPR